MAKKRKFSRKDPDRLTDQMFMTQMVTSFVMILMCVAMMCTSAFAFFSSTVTSSTNTIKSASYVVDVRSEESLVPDEDGWYLLVYPQSEEVSAIDDSDSNGEEEIQETESENLTGVQVGTETYSFVLSKNEQSTAKVGFVKIEVKWQKGDESESEVFEFYTQPIGTFMKEETEKTVNERLIGVEVPEGYSVLVRFTYEWGTYSDEGILSSSAISNLEAPDSIHYVSLITTEDYGVEITDLEEVLVAVTTNMQDTALETYGLSEEQIIEEIRNTLFVTVDGEEYKDYLLEMEELVLPLEADIEVPIIVIYPGSDIKLRTEVSTVVYLKHTVPVLSVEGGNSTETALETRGLTAEQIVEEIRKLLTVQLDDEVCQQYQLLVDETIVQSLLTPVESVVEVPVTIVVENTEHESTQEVSTVIYMKHTVPALSVEGGNSAETALETRGLTAEQIVEEIRNLLTVRLDNETYHDYELSMDQTIIESLLVPTEGIKELSVAVIYPGTELYPRQEVSKTVYLKHTYLPALAVVSNTDKTPVEIESAEEIIDAVRGVITVCVDDVETSDYHIELPEEWQLTEDGVFELSMTVSVVCNESTVSQEVIVYVKKAQPKEEPGYESNDSAGDDETEEAPAVEQSESEGETEAEEEISESEGSDENQ